MDKHYRNTFIPKHDGSKRKLSVPDTILKKVQRSISDNILSHYPISRYATAYTSGSSVQKNASLHVGKQKILKLDIDGFFDHITYSKVKDIVFFKENYSEQIRILLTMLCYSYNTVVDFSKSIVERVGERIFDDVEDLTVITNHDCFNGDWRNVKFLSE